MSEDDDDRRFAAIAARARAAMTAGATVDDVLHTFRTEEQLGAIESMRALRTLAPMNLSCVKLLVSNWCEGRSYAHLTLSDLELLSDAPRTGVVDFLTRCHRDDAIIERKPFLLYVCNRQTTGAVCLYTSATPLDTQPIEPPHGTVGSISGSSVTFERLRDDARRAAAAWPTELHIVRDEPDQLLLQFIRASSAG